MYSYREGFGNVVLEAACLELPTIVSDIPGLRDTTESKITGFVIEPGNHKVLARSIMTLYKNKEYAHSLGVNGRRRAVRYFRNKVIWNKQLELYNNLLPKK